MRSGVHDSRTTRVDLDDSSGDSRNIGVDPDENSGSEPSKQSKKISRIRHFMHYNDLQTFTEGRLANLQTGARATV